MRWGRNHTDNWPVAGEATIWSRVVSGVVLIGWIVVAVHGTVLTLRLAGWGASAVLQALTAPPAPSTWSESDVWNEERRRWVDELERQRIEEIERRLEELDRQVPWPSDPRKSMEEQDDDAGREGPRFAGGHVAAGHAARRSPGLRGHD